MRRLKAAIGLALAAACLYFVFRNVDVGAVAEAFGQFKAYWLLPALALYAADYWLRAERWRELLAPIQKAKTATLLDLLVIGNTVNNVLPARLGDVTRAVLCKRRFGMSRSSALATIFVEKIGDGVATLGFFLAAVALSPKDLGQHGGVKELVGGMTESQFVSWMNLAMRVSAWIFGLALLFSILGIAFRSRTARLIEWTAARAPGRLGATLHRIGHMFLEGLSVLKSPAGMAATAVITLLLWAAEAGVYYTIGRGFHEPIPFAAIVMLVAIVNLAVMLPSSPGFWGPFELVAIGVLKLFGVSGGVAVAFTLVTHLFLIVPLAGAGALAMAREHLHLKDVREAETSAAEPDPEESVEGSNA